MPNTDSSAVIEKPWFSFCISTFKRPLILKEQLMRISGQTYKNFEVVISDNDPEESARKVVEGIEDSRFKYFSNGRNLGMINSFNKSIERSLSDYIIMITDDDPVEENFLEYFYEIIQKFPGFSLYGGFDRAGKKKNAIEKIPGENFIVELLDPKKTRNLLWSSVVIRKKDALLTGLIPDYGSPHLADHALMALVGNVNGGIMVNKMYSTLSSHDTNFSKSNFRYYVSGCTGFYTAIKNSTEKKAEYEKNMTALHKHLNFWFISVMFSLKRYFVIKKDPQAYKAVEQCAQEILSLPFMKKNALRYRFKSFIFSLKRVSGCL